MKKNRRKKEKSEKVKKVKKPKKKQTVFVERGSFRDCIDFYAPTLIASLAGEFGFVTKMSRKDSYFLRINKRYDYDEVVEWLLSFNTDGWLQASEHYEPLLEDMVTTIQELLAVIDLMKEVMQEEEE